jgi:hypothetical protein
MRPRFGLWSTWSYSLLDPELVVDIGMIKRKRGGFDFFGDLLAVVSAGGIVCGASDGCRGCECASAD